MQLPDSSVPQSSARSIISMKRLVAIKYLFTPNLGEILAVARETVRLPVRSALFKQHTGGLGG